MDNSLLFHTDDFETEESKLNQISSKAKTVWRNMISRCYNPSSSSYKYYGLKGVRVCDEWTDFSSFFHDIRQIDGFNETLFLNGVLQLDKDSKQQDIPKFRTVYSKETCVWITRDENLKIARKPRKFQASPPGGGVIEFEGMRAFCRLYNLPYSSVRRCLKGEQRATKCGWTDFKYID